MIVGVLTNCHKQYTWDSCTDGSRNSQSFFSYDVRCAVVKHFSAWCAVY